MTQQRELETVELLRLVSVFSNNNDIKIEEILRILNIDISKLTVSDFKNIQASLAGISNLSPNSDQDNNKK